MAKPSSKPTPSSRSYKLRQFYLRWHRRIGLACLLVFLMVAVTGVLLNHTKYFELGGKHVHHPKLLKHYGYNVPTVSSFRVNGYWLSHLGGDYLYRDAEQLAYCPEQLVGAIKLRNDLVIAACNDQLLLLSPAGEVIERLGDTYGVPTPIEKLGYCDKELCLKSGGIAYRADVDHLNWQILTMQSPPQWSMPERPDKHLRHKLKQKNMGDGPSLERLLLDLHSGRLFGDIGVWIVDLSALGLVLLSLSGFYLWWKQFSRRKP